MPAVNRRQLLRFMDDPKLPFPDRVARMMTYQAALHAATGKPLKDMDTEDEVDTEELDEYAKKLWNLGIGTRMFEEMTRIAVSNPDLLQLELEYVEGNSRARALYEKMGFRIAGVRPDAIRLKDGTILNEYLMMKKL